MKIAVKDMAFIITVSKLIYFLLLSIQRFNLCIFCISIDALKISFLREWTKTWWKTLCAFVSNLIEIIKLIIKKQERCKKKSLITSYFRKLFLLFMWVSVSVLLILKIFSLWICPGVLPTLYNGCKQVQRFPTLRPNILKSTVLFTRT